MIDLPTTKMICLRSAAYIDDDLLAQCETQEVLFRDKSGFFLYLCSGIQISHTNERVFRLAAREALIWLNEENSHSQACTQSATVR